MSSFCSVSLPIPLTSRCSDDVASRASRYGVGLRSEIGLQPLRGLHQIGFADDVTAVEDAAGFMAGQSHRDTIGNSNTHPTEAD